MALARSSDVGVTSFSELLSKKPEAKTFIDIHLREFCLCAELRGEDMDGVLASATLEDLGVYEVGADMNVAGAFYFVMMHFLPENSNLKRKCRESAEIKHNMCRGVYVEVA